MQHAKQIDPAMPLAANKAYLYGQFKLDRDRMNYTRVYLRVENLDTGSPVDIRMLEQRESIYAVEVGPGMYRIKEFMFTMAGPASMTLSSDAKRFGQPTEASYLIKPVKVEAGKAYYLGEFSSVTRRSEVPNSYPMMLRFSAHLTGISQNFEVTTNALKNRYPAFASIECRPAYDQQLSGNHGLDVGSP